MRPRTREDWRAQVNSPAQLASALALEFGQLVDILGGIAIREASSEWVRAPTMFRLRLYGTGTCVMDSRNALGVITTAVESYSCSGATNQIEFPYAGDDALDVRFTLTGTCTAQIL